MKEKTLCYNIGRMKIKCIRSVISKNGITEITYFFDTETLEFEFDEKDTQLLIDLYQKKAQDIPEFTDFS
jgi:hypothetical protein